MMSDWVIANYVDSSLTGAWVYYLNLKPKFQNIHFSRCVDNGDRDHVATDDGAYYYFGVTGTFNTTPPSITKKRLKDAWKDYFTVQQD